MSCCSYFVKRILLKGKNEDEYPWNWINIFFSKKQFEKKFKRSNHGGHTVFLILKTSVSYYNVFPEKKLGQGQTHTRRQKHTFEPLLDQIVF